MLDVDFNRFMQEKMKKTQLLISLMTDEKPEFFGVLLSNTTSTW